MYLSFSLGQTSGHMIISRFPYKSGARRVGFCSVRLAKESSVFCTSETPIVLLVGEYQGDHSNSFP